MGLLRDIDLTKSVNPVEKLIKILETQPNKAQNMMKEMCFIKVFLSH